MKKILLSSLLAVMAVTSANAKIASTDYADGVAESKAAAAETAAKSYADGVATAAETAAKSYTDAEVAKKQDIISDLSTIRDGASKGATAVQNFNSLTNEAEVTGTNDGNYVTSVTQTNGKIKASVVAFDTSLSANSTNAPQSKVVKSYVDNAIDGVNGVIGEGYQKLSDKLKSSDTSTQVTEANKDTLYPTVGKTQMIADAAQAAANTYTDEEVAKKQDVINDLSTIREGASKGATAVQNFNSLTNEAEVTGTNDGNYVTSVTQTNGKIKASVVAFDTSLSANSTNAVQNKVIKSYVDNAIDTVEGDVSGKVSINQGEANKDKGLIVNASGNLALTDVATDAELDTVSGVANNAKTIADGAVAVNTQQGTAISKNTTDIATNTAAIALNTALRVAIENNANKVDGEGAEGTYALTAVVNEQGVSEFKWEKIGR